MKRMMGMLLVLAMVFSLAACGEKTVEPPKEQVQQAQQPDTEYSFAVSTDVYEDIGTAEDGTLLIHVRYELPHLDIVPETGGDSVLDAQMLAVRNTFNEEAKRQRNEQIDFFAQLCDAAKEDYQYVSESGLDWCVYADEMSIGSTYQTDGGLLSIYASTYIGTGGAHPTNGFATWNYDLNEGKFLQYSDFTDDEAALRAVVAEEILSQIDAQELAEGLFEDYEASVQELSYAETYFSEAGMIVCFPEYILGPHAAGLPSFIVPYETINGAMNDYGRALLNL